LRKTQIRENLWETEVFKLNGGVRTLIILRINKKWSKNMFLGRIDPENGKQCVTVQNLVGISVVMSALCTF